mmetsp:Transcript_30892/g.33219  ORF Transcript_30892/g.33219 Transcript_30892/m.33219 type:complete len:521 (-) Transcript_30892:65-1627(-)
MNIYSRQTFDSIIINVMVAIMLCRIAKSFECFHSKSYHTHVVESATNMRKFGGIILDIGSLSQQPQLRCQSRHQSRRQQLIHNLCISGSRIRLFATKTVESTPLFPDANLADIQIQFQRAIVLMHANVKETPDNLDIIVEELEMESSDPKFWDAENKDRNTRITAQLSSYSRLQNRLKDWRLWREDGETALEMLSQAEAMKGDKEWGSDDVLFTDAEYHSLVEEIQTSANELLKDGERFQLELLLSSPYDKQNCRILLTAGAGGTESNDWVSDLKRMYERHAQKMGYVLKIEDEQQGDVVGYKSVEMIVSSSMGGSRMAQHPYGWFKGEKGTHRLVRLSPFNANNKRQTTFAGVDVAPIFLDEDKLRNIVIPDKDLEITFMRSGGAGGQNVNKVSSAVRIKHLPSGLNIKCTQERSQAINKDLAMKRLKSQLLAIAMEQRVAEIKEIRGDQVEASWGTQIRNYVMHPYKMIKDQRTGWETSNIQNFMDGDLEDCIAELLKTQAKDEQKASLQENDAEIAT